MMIGMTTTIRPIKAGMAVEECVPCRLAIMGDRKPLVIQRSSGLSAIIAAGSGLNL